MKNLTLLVLILLIGVSVNAQHEVGVSLGTAHLLGDFGGGVGNGTIFIKDIDLKATKPSVGLFYRYNFAKFLALRGQFIYGGLYSNDIYSENEFRKARGLTSKTSLMDVTAQLEFNFIPLQFCSGKARFSPYVAGGIGLSKTNPEITAVSGEGIPAEEIQYIDPSGSGIALNLPLSLGLKYKTKKNIVLGLETTYRLAFTDQLDSYVRQQNDQYFFITANISYVFCKNNGFGKMSKEMRCPTYK